MKTYLLPEKGNFYKANLHCHTTVSDGKWTPEQVKENYQARGYSIVAYTDHSVFVTHNELGDDSFLPLNGYEISFREPSDSLLKRKCHICLISLDPDKQKHKYVCNDAYLKKNEHVVRLASDMEYISDDYSGAHISDVIKKAAKDNFFVTYNHPIWSLETKDEYRNYHGMHAMEIVNWNCITEGYNDRNENIYDQMLRDGKKIYCLAADDNHDAYPIGHPKNDSFGGFTVIKAEELSYDAVAEALVKGNFYSSEGPEIKELYFEDGKVHITSSEAVRIVMSTECRQYRTVTAERQGDTVTSAIFEIRPAMGVYVRFTVFDREGKAAYTNAYFLSDLTL